MDKLGRDSYICTPYDYHCDCDLSYPPFQLVPSGRDMASLVSMNTLALAQSEIP